MTPSATIIIILKFYQKSLTEKQKNTITESGKRADMWYGDLVMCPIVLAVLCSSVHGEWS
jgi:hypothetical protein